MSGLHLSDLNKETTYLLRIFHLESFTEACLPTDWRLGT